MPVLSTQQRNALESAVTTARRVAEQGALNALQAMAVDQPEPFAHMDAAQRSLHQSLRSKASLLGDAVQANGKNSKQPIAHLSYELAYETWHKMLFAKFLEANNLLMHPDGVAVTMADCEELAKEEGYADKWDAAANYASRMLPAIFRMDDPLMRVSYASNDRINLETIIEQLGNEQLGNGIFTADDALGWVYQFWQSEAKAEINASGDKIDGKRLPAVTQLFTEPYMVHFLIDNTLGAWWVRRNPGVQPPVKFDYLRLFNNGAPAAGTFEGWPDATAAVTSLDPCMGSGHCIAALFPVFAALRMHEEGLSKEEATDKVIAENLHGLELDPRCTQIAAFNLALTAWKFCGRYKTLPEMHLACSGIAPTGNMNDWVKLVGNEHPDNKARMEAGMHMLYKHFQLAPELGSLLDPTTIHPDAFTASFEELQPVLKKALENEADAENTERGVMAAGLAKAGQLLGKKYTLQITNVPYLSRGKQGQVMADYIEKHYAEAKGDLATVFLEKMLKANTPGGISCSVIPQNWLFLTSYRRLREKLLNNETWNLVARLGVKGFQTPMWDFNVMLIALAHAKPHANHPLVGLDVSDAPNAAAKDAALKTATLKSVKQLSQLGNPDAVVSLDNIEQKALLGKYASALAGIDTGDGNRFKFKFFELPVITKDWIVELNSFEGTKEFSGRTHILYWQNGEGGLLTTPGATIRNVRYWNKKGVYVVRMAKTPATISWGEAWDRNGAMIIPANEDYLLAIWEYSKSDDFRNNLRKLNQKLSISEATFPRINFDLAHWQKVAAKKYPNGLPKPYSDDPTQWLFHGHPIKTERPLHVAVARVLGYRWPAESDKEMELAKEARGLINAVQAFDAFSDADGIVCIPSVNGEQAGADRLREYLQAVFKAEWTPKTITQLLEQEGAASANLESWLRDEFFVQHCKLFQHRPFIWHIWDGRKDGFAALVNYHKLTKTNLSKLIYTYLGDWIRMCEAKKRGGESGAEGLLSAAIRLKEELEAIVEGGDPYDIFVRWKPLQEQPIGWDPDVNDGVRLNIRPFMVANILRKKPNIKWGIDRGKNPEGSHWGQVRDNDTHLSLEEKRAARIKPKK